MGVDKKYMTEEVQQLVEEWFSKGVQPEEAGLILLIAEKTNEQPDSLRLRLEHLRKQCECLIYDLDYTIASAEIT